MTKEIIFSWNIINDLTYTFSYTQHFCKQRQAEIGKTLSKN